jgi:acyl carrier protein
VNGADVSTIKPAMAAPPAVQDRSCVSTDHHHEIAHEECARASTATEEVLANLWAKLLRRERIGIHDNLWQSGGHSLLAMNLISHVRETFGVDLPFATLFEMPTVAELALYLDRASPAASNAISPAAKSAYYDLSVSQARFWLAQQLEPDASVFHVIAICDDLCPTHAADARAIRDAALVLVKRHEALRTVFAVRGGRPVQIIKDLIEPDVQEFTVASRDELEGVLSREARRPFDLEQGPLIRITAIHTWDARTLLLLNIHHIVSDGKSLQIARRELFELLRRQGDGVEAQFTTPRLQLKDYAAWEKGFISSHRIDESAAFWRKRLMGAKGILHLPADFTGPGADVTKRAAYYCVAPARLHAQLRALAAGSTATVFMIVAAAFFVLLSRLTGQRDIVVGLPISSRNHHGLDDVIGCFINFVLLRADVDPDQPFTALLACVRSDFLQALRHQYYPYDRIVSELRLPRNERGFAIPSVFFNALNFVGEYNDLAGKPAHRDHPIEARTDWDVYVREDRQGIFIDCHYRRSLFEPDTIERTFREFERLLAHIVADPTCKVADFDSAHPCVDDTPADADVSAALRPATDRDVLSNAPDVNKPAADRSTSSASERLIASLYCELLGTQEISFEQTFYDAGGTSLRMISLQAAIAAATGKEIPLVKLFEHPTIRSLARYLDADAEDLPDARHTAERMEKRRVRKGVRSRS